MVGATERDFFFFCIMMKITLPTTSMTATEQPTAMPAMTPTLRPLEPAGGGAAGSGGAGADEPAPDAGVLTVVTVLTVIISVESIVAAAVVSDIADAMVVAPVAAAAALSKPILMVSTTLPPEAVMSTFPGATRISCATFCSMAVSTAVVKEAMSA